MSWIHFGAGMCIEKIKRSPDLVLKIGNTKQQQKKTQITLVGTVLIISYLPTGICLLLVSKYGSGTDNGFIWFCLECAEFAHHGGGGNTAPDHGRHLDTAQAWNTYLFYHDSFLNV